MSNGAAAGRGSRPPVGRKAGIASYAEDESCAEMGCTTVLSRYNASDRCAVHDDRGQTDRSRPAT